MEMHQLNRDFYNRDTLTVSRELLGKYIVHEINAEKLIARIVEVEAYNGPEDKACHSFGNKMTKRNRVMFGPPGHAYVYLIYGMYYCLNVVTEQEGKPCAVLIRGVEPVEGQNMMAQLRYHKDYDVLDRRQRYNLTSGPGKLCIALGITKEYNGMDLCKDRLYIAEGHNELDFEIVSTTRVNINYAEEYVDKPWRYYIKGNSYVSKK